MNGRCQLLQHRTEVLGRPEQPILFALCQSQSLRMPASEDLAFYLQLARLAGRFLSRGLGHLRESKVLPSGHVVTVASYTTI